MRFIIILTGLLLSIYSCDSSKSAMKGDSDTEMANDTVRIANDSLEYEILIIEPGFNSWLVTQFPREYYSLSTLENRNAFYVSAYNRRVLDPSRYNPDLYPQQINYELNIDYGLEVNYLLYNYFVYFEKTYKQKL